MMEARLGRPVWRMSEGEFQMNPLHIQFPFFYFIPIPFEQSGQGR